VTVPPEDIEALAFLVLKMAADLRDARSQAIGAAYERPLRTTIRSVVAWNSKATTARWPGRA